MITFKRLLLLVPFLLLLVPADALAEIPQSPQWTVTSVSAPTNFAPGDQSGEDLYRVSVMNTGGASERRQYDRDLRRSARRFEPRARRHHRHGPADRRVFEL